MRASYPFQNRFSDFFLAIYETGSVQEASQRLGVSQPAVSVGLRQLEEHLGTKVFERTASGMVATQAGKIFHRHASFCRQTAHYAESEIAALTSGVTGHMRIGVGVAWAATFIPDVVFEVHKQFPALHLSVVSGVAGQLTDMLHNGELDIVLSASPAQQDQSNFFLSQLIATVQMLAVARKEHPLFERGKVSLSDLVEQNWVSFADDTAFEQTASGFMASHGLPSPTSLIKTNSPSVLTEFTRRADIISVIAEPLLQKARESGLEKLALQSPLWSIPINIQCSRTALELAPYQLFLDIVKGGLRAEDWG